MPAITGCTTQQFLPNANLRVEIITTPATADSGDTIDISSAAATGGNTLKSLTGILIVFDTTTGDVVTGTWSGTTVTIDASGGTTNHVYVVFAIGT